MYGAHEAQRVDQPVLVLSGSVVCVSLDDCVLLIWLPRWDFILIDSFPHPFVKLTSRRTGIAEVHPKRSLRATEVGAIRLCVIPALNGFVCRSFSRLFDRRQIGQSEHQTAAVSVWACRRVGARCTAWQSIDLQLLLWSLAFVRLIYFSRRPSFRCHSLTLRSDRSWVLHRWENNAYLWPLELVFFSKSPRERML